MGRYVNKFRRPLASSVTSINAVFQCNVFRFIAAKSYYFGVGGGTRQFQSLVEEDGEFDVRVVWKSEQGKRR